MDIIYYLKLVIIIVLIYVIYNLIYVENFANNKHHEHHEHKNHEQHEHKHEHKHHEHYPLEEYVGHHKLVNVITQYNGKDYYLTMEELLNCGNPQKLDCLFYTPILMELEEHKHKKDKKENELNNLSEICNLKRSQDCRNKLTAHGKNKDVSKDKLEECNKPYDECRKELHEATEFTIVHYGKAKHEKRSFRESYKIIGALHDKNGKLIRHSLNTPSGISKSNFICFDGNVKNHDITTTFEFIEVPKNSPSDPQTYALRFQRHANLSRVLLYNHDGSPKTYDLYVGACLDNRCEMNGKKYLRLCTYENLNDINILHFRLNLVKK